MLRGAAEKHLGGVEFRDFSLSLCICVMCMCVGTCIAEDRDQTTALPRLPTTYTHERVRNTHRLSVSPTPKCVVRTSDNGP